MPDGCAVRCSTCVSQSTQVLDHCLRTTKISTIPVGYCSWTGIMTEQSFNKLASDYCAFLEDHCAYSAKQFTTQCATLLGAIDQGLSELPEANEVGSNGPDLGPTQWIARNISDKIADLNGHMGTLPDDLTQIYRYLKHGLLIYSTDPSAAVGYWKAHFVTDCQPDLERARTGLG